MGDKQRVENLGPPERPEVRALLEKFAELMDQFDPHKDLQLVGVLTSEELGEGAIVMVGLSPMDGLLRMLSCLPELGAIAGVPISAVRIPNTDTDPPPPLAI